MTSIPERTQPHKTAHFHIDGWGTKNEDQLKENVGYKRTKE